MLFKKSSTHVREVKDLEDDSISGVGSLPLISGKDASFGMNPAIKTFYEGRHSAGQGYGGAMHYNWVEKPPKQLSAKTARTYDGVALKIYKIRDQEQPAINGRQPLKIHMIDVQSPYLIAALKDIVEKVGVFLEAHTVAVFRAPFRSLYFCHEEIAALAQRQRNDPVLGAHLRLLLSVLGELFDAFRAQLAHLRTSGLISYKLAWTFFARGSAVYCREGGTERILRVVDTVYETQPRPLMRVRGEELAFDGDDFAWKSFSACIPPFDGNVPVTELPIYPLSLHADRAALTSRLAARGTAALQYQDVALRECEGVGWSTVAGDMARNSVTGRVIIDFYGYQKYHRGLERTETKPKSEESRSKKKERQPADFSASVEEAHCYGAPTPPDVGSVPDVYVQRLSAAKQAANRAKMQASPEELMFMSPILYGYSLKGKEWLEFHVDDLRPVQWNDEAYEHLVYPAEQKDLVLSFVQNHRSSAASAAAAGVDDVILGKGRGLVILLSGPPGTGKTLTAEATADQTRRPLFTVQAEDLGTSAALLGSSLKKAFAMAADWNAVVLLDEADVFMAVRQPSDVQRNELVSIFLRELEYFSGTIFLTTNLLQTIDAAFRSRVDIHLLFNSLPASARELLWRKFLRRLPPPRLPAADVAEGTTGSAPTTVQLSDEAFRQLARWSLNGREIKNAVKTVRSWCLCKGYPMDFYHLEAGIRVTSPMACKNDGDDAGREWTGEGGWGAER